MEEIIEIPKGINVSLKDGLLSVKGPRGTVSKKFIYEYARIELQGNAIKIYTTREKKSDTSVIGTWRSIISSLFIGVTKGYIYTMKIVYAHFPVKVTVKGNEITLDNFLGEKSPRKLILNADVKVNIKGDIVTLEGNDLETLGNAAARIEKLSKIKGFDPRVFQDGIYIVKKGDIIEG
ncbi:MAG: 50S ribosomal protein L6 [Thermoplasmata archaeon]